MKFLSHLIAGLLFATAIANAGYLVYDTDTHFRSLYFTRDGAAQSEIDLSPVRDSLLKRGVSQLGYLLEPNADFHQREGEFYGVQYALAPVLLRNIAKKDDWVLMNYVAVGKPFASPDVVLVQDFGYGLALCRRRDAQPALESK